MKISVITVALNSAATIADTLDSVAGQRHANIEHLVVDGQSSDSTLMVVESRRHDRLRWVSEPDAGLYDAMNKGLRMSRGEVVGFLNADDLYSDEFALTRVAQAFSDPLVDACYGDLIYITHNKRRIARHWRSRPYDKGLFAKGWRPPHPTFYIRRSAFERLGEFNLRFRLAADFEFMMRYLEDPKVRSRYIPHVLVQMRLGGATNRSWSNIVSQNREILEAIRAHNGHCSPLVFWTHKLAHQIWQRVAARRVRSIS